MNDATHSKKALLEFEKVDFQYLGSKTKLLNQVSFSVQPGERKGIIGDNGSGKSTIAKLILGLYTPKGIVNLFGKRVQWGNHYSQLGYIGDPSYKPGQMGLPTEISVREVVHLAKKLWTIAEQTTSMSQVNQRLHQLEEQLELPQFHDRDVGDLSKGQRMRLMAFLALGKQPRLLIADEATEGLDERSAKTVISTIKSACSNQGLGMLWISHKKYEVVMLSDHVCVLKGGNLSEVQIPKFKVDIETNSEQESLNFANGHSISTSKDIGFEILGDLFTKPSISRFKIEGNQEN
jgi:energy-coupling factor transport system ATP-binding protein